MPTTIGMPEIQIAFQSAGMTAIQRSERGVVVLLLKDTVATEEKYMFRSLANVKETEFTPENYDYIRLAFRASPYRVYVYITDDAALGETLKGLQTINFDYLAMPEATSEQNEAIGSWIKAQRKPPNNKIYKYVAGNYAADHEGIINFATDNIVVATKTYTAQEFTARMAGIIAAQSLYGSVTFKAITEVESCDEYEDRDAAIKQGKLILFSDGTAVKIARGVNSLSTIGQAKPEDFCKIKLVEAMDLVANDIRSTFYNSYVGNYNNSYDNKLQFIKNINLVYFKTIADSVLERAYDNRVDIDEEKQAQYAITRGEDIDTMSAAEIRQYPTGSEIFLAGKIKFLDAIEDLDLVVNI